LINRFVQRLGPKEEMSPEVYFALIEEARQRTKNHYELEQPAKYNSVSAEYVTRLDGSGC
jgi:hypothetical protein